MWISLSRYQSYIRIGSINVQLAIRLPWADSIIYKKEHDTEKAKTVEEKIMIWYLIPIKRIQSDTNQTIQNLQNDTMKTEEETIDGMTVEAVGEEMMTEKDVVIVEMIKGTTIVKEITTVIEILEANGGEMMIEEEDNSNKAAVYYCVAGYL
jgi:predicted SpoU family rRNA methylase